MIKNSFNNRVEFVRLREAYHCLSVGIQSGCTIKKVGRSFVLTGLEKIEDVSVRANIHKHKELISDLIEGPGEKRSLSGQREVCISCARCVDENGGSYISITALELVGRSRINRSLVVKTSQDSWISDLNSFTDWGAIKSVVSAADGNNQRSMIGLVLTVSGIGRGSLSMTEVEVPQEIDETTHLVRSSEWMKAGLPRFLSSSSEAIWYTMRLRSVHSRLVVERKQGFYTALGLSALHGAGLSKETIGLRLHLPDSLVTRMISGKETSEVSERDVNFIQNLFPGDGVEGSNLSAAVRIWKGAAIYVRGADWRISASIKARKLLGKGVGLVEAADELKIQRRDLVRILSVSVVEMKQERDRFLNGVVTPKEILSLV